jgi:hypothetical protein
MIVNALTKTGETRGAIVRQAGLRSSLELRIAGEGVRRSTWARWFLHRPF